MLSICAMESDQFGSVDTFKPQILPCICILVSLSISFHNANAFDLYIYIDGSDFCSENTFQLQENEIWNNIEPFVNVLLDDAIYNYTKQKAIETIAKLVETRTTSLGYIIFSYNHHVYWINDFFWFVIFTES